MRQLIFEIIVPAGKEADEEGFFLELDKLSKNILNQIVVQKRLLNVGMELFQNISKHRLQDRIAVLRIYQEKQPDLYIQTFNFAQGAISDKLNEKFHFLKNTGNLKSQFQQKLLQKVENTEFKSGDLGLDLCFRYSRKAQIKIHSFQENQRLIFLNFQI